MSRIALANALAIPAAGTTTTTPVKGLAEIGDVTGYLNFDYGSGGTSLDVYLQTSFDGTNWYDIIHWPQYTTADAVDILSVSSAGDLTTAPTEGDAALAAGTVQSGMIGDQLRLKVVVVGTYVASTLTVIAEARADAGGAGSSVSGALTDKSGTITSGGTAQSAAAAKANRRYLFLLNPSTETETLWFSTVATAVRASPSIPLLPGQSFEYNGTFCPTGALSVIATTTGHVFIAREG